VPAEAECLAYSKSFQKRIGGQLNIFQSSLPTVGPGALKHREDPKVYNTEKEKTLFAPADPFYRTSAEEFVESGVGVNLFLFPSQYIDVATIGKDECPLHHDLG
jgi:protein transport protein SEC24